MWRGKIKNYPDTSFLFPHFLGTFYRERRREGKREKKKKKKMLAVFDKSVAKSPEGLQSPHHSHSAASSSSALKDGFLAQHFASLHPGTISINLGPSGLICYSSDKQNPLFPRFSTFSNLPFFSPHLGLDRIPDFLFACRIRGLLILTRLVFINYGFGRSEAMDLIFSFLFGFYVIVFCRSP